MWGYEKANESNSVRHICWREKGGSEKRGLWKLEARTEEQKREEQEAFLRP